MRVLYWYCTELSFRPALRALEEAPEAEPGSFVDSVVAFIHVEPKDVVQGSHAETKLVKNAKWLARKWDTQRILLHSFTHLGEDKADPGQAHSLLHRTQERLVAAGYEAFQTPYGFFCDLQLSAPGHPLARIYKEW